MSHIQVGTLQTRETRKPAKTSVENLCEEEMRTWPDIWLHRWAVEYATFRYAEGRSHPSAFAAAFKSVRDQIASGAEPPLCCETAWRLAGANP
jgi:hypothetical protein